jgi:hypothetical protein
MRAQEAGSQQHTAAAATAVRDWGSCWLPCRLNWLLLVQLLLLLLLLGLHAPWSDQMLLLTAGMTWRAAAAPASALHA